MGSVKGIVLWRVGTMGLFVRSVAGSCADSARHHSLDLRRNYVVYVLLLASIVAIWGGMSRKVNDKKLRPMYSLGNLQVSSRRDVET